MAGQTITGKAFEYACLEAFKQRLTRNNMDVKTHRTQAFLTAQEAFKALSPEYKQTYMEAAETAVKLIFPLEPKLEHGRGTIMLSLASDSAGIKGDVRDLLCVRISDNWEIGISCKHNHAALKHPRITEAGNFGFDWTGYNCSSRFLDEIGRITKQLDGHLRWKQIPDKQEKYYVPILRLYAEEIERLCKAHSDFPERLLGYFFGAEDFYKVISMEAERSTKVEAFNLHGTMNQPAGTHRSIYRVARLNMPKRLLDITQKGNTTIIVTFDGGWVIKMRLHNKDDVAKPTSLAWDVNLAGMPPELYQQQRSWDE